MRAPDRLETERLVLRRPVMSDAQEIFDRYAGDEEVTRLVGWPRHLSVSDTEAFLAFDAAAWERGPAGAYLIRSRQTGELLGSTGLDFHGPNQALTGYVLAKDSWSRGYATEALGAIVGLANRLEVFRLSALCHPAHEKSQRVLRRCGFLLDERGTRQVEYPNLAPGIRQDALLFRRDLAVAGSTATGVVNEAG